MICKYSQALQLSSDIMSCPMVFANLNEKNSNLFKVIGTCHLHNSFL